LVRRGERRRRLFELSRIWVKTWAQIIDERETQLRSFKDALNYDASRQHAVVDYINRHIAEDQVPAGLRVPKSVSDEASTNQSASDNVAVCLAVLRTIR
jgi:hypothetical protein